MVNSKYILNFIKDYCKNNKITMAYIARMAGISRSWLSRILSEENKNMTINCAQKLLAVCGYTLKISKAKYEIKKMSRLAKMNE